MEYQPGRPEILQPPSWGLPRRCFHENCERVFGLQRLRPDLAAESSTLWCSEKASNAKGVAMIACVATNLLVAELVKDESAGV